MKQDLRQRLGINISVDCQWSGKEICKVFAEALTDANFHSLRKKLMPIINKELKCRIPLEG